MSECKINNMASSAAWDACPRCGSGPCEVWRDQIPPIASDPESKVPNPPSGGPTEIRPDPAYAAALSEQAILVDARARAVDLAIKAFGPLPADPAVFENLFEVSNRVLAYLLEGK